MFICNEGGDMANSVADWTPAGGGGGGLCATSDAAWTPTNGGDGW